MISEKTQELLKYDRDHVIHLAWPVGADLFGVVFEEGHGIMIRDTEGKEYIDGSSGLVGVNLGHGRKEIIDAAIEQLHKLQFAPIFWGWSNKACIECARKLAEITPPGLDHFEFVSGGSEAVETACKFARQYWQSRGINRYKIISLYNSYHGCSLATSTMSAFGTFTWDYLSPLAAGFLHIPAYDCYRCPFRLDYPSCGIECAHFLAETIEREGAGSVAAFIAEPIQGAGGCIAPPPEYWPMVRRICTEHDVLLIGDEVMSGFARTGKLFALEHWNVIPDIMTVAKGITGCYFPFGAVAINNRVYQGLKEGHVVSTGFTWSGNPIGAAAAIAAMDVYIKEKVVENAARVGQHLEERLKAEFEPLPCVGTLNGMGLFRSIEIVKDKTTKASFDPSLKVLEKVRERARENGLIVRVTRNLSVTVAPPCITTIEEMDRLLDILYPIVASIKPE